MQELNFPEGFFESEEREGFFVEEKMKRAWAAQMKILCEFEEVCNKHGLIWYAAYGTLLGTVRHKGFIPWDDDMDVYMPRPSYEIFRKKAYRDMPKGYATVNFHNHPDHKDFLTRVVNHPNIDFSPETMEKYYGCPYACGLDIFPVDYIPTKPLERDMYLTVTGLLARTATSIDNGDFSNEEQKMVVSRIEKMTKKKIARGLPVSQQLRIICEEYLKMFGPNDTDRMGIGIRQFQWPDYNAPKECYESVTKLPFECIDINVPVGYKEILKITYGEDYMTPKQVITHDYPFYKSQDAVIEEYRRNHLGEAL